MVRPTTKKELIKAGNDSFYTLVDLLDSLSFEQRETPFSFDPSKEKGDHWARDRNIHDVLIHLYEWHKLMLKWVKNNIKGNHTQFLKKGYNWKTYGLMNVEFMEENKDKSYAEALYLFKSSHTNVMNLIDTFSNEELFCKGVFPWVGGTTLGSYFISVTSSHYNWAVKKIRKFKKML